MLLREDVVVGVESADAASDNTDDVDRATTEGQTQLRESTSIENDMQENHQHDGSKYTQEPSDSMLNRQNSQSGVLNSSPLIVENVRRFPLNNMTVDEEHRNFLTPFNNNRNMTLDIAHRWKYEYLKDSSVMPWKTTDVACSKSNDTLKSFPIINGRKSTRYSFPCSKINTVESYGNDRTTSESPTQLIELINNTNNNQANKRDNGNSFHQDSMDIILNTFIINKSQLKNQNLRRFPLNKVTVDGDHRSFLTPFNNNRNTTIEVAHRWKYAHLEEPPVMRWRTKDVACSKSNDTLKSFPLINRRKQAKYSFPCLLIHIVDSDDSVTMERPTQLAKSINNGNQQDDGSNFTQEPLDSMSNRQNSPNVVLDSSQLKLEKVRRFPLKNVTFEGGRSSFLTPFNNNRNITLDIAHRWKYAHLKESPVMPWRATDITYSKSKETLKYFPIINGSKEAKFSFPYLAVHSLHSERKYLRHIQNEDENEHSFGMYDENQNREAVKNLNILGFEDVSKNSEEENLQNNLENENDLLHITSETLLERDNLRDSESGYCKDTQEGIESEEQNAKFSDLALMASGSENENFQEKQDQVGRELFTSITDQESTFNDITEMDEKISITDFENHISHRETEIVVEKINFIFPCENSRATLKTQSENYNEFQEIIDKPKEMSSLFPLTPVPMTGLRKTSSEDIKFSTSGPNDSNVVEVHDATHQLLFPLTIDNTNSGPQSHKFPTGFIKTEANNMNAKILANGLMEFSTCHFCHHNLMPLLATTTATATTATTTTMTQCQVSHSGHAQRIQVQYNNDQLLKTIENGPDLLELINCCVREHKCEQQKQQQQYINDAKLATAQMAKNTTAAAIMSSQTNDEHNNFDYRREPTQLDSQLSAHILLEKNYDEQRSTNTAPPPMSEILAELLQQARDLVDAIGTLNQQTFYADSQQLRRPSTPATCSDVRDSSSQEVSQICEDGVSVKVVTPPPPPPPPLTSPEAKNQVKYEYDLELLPTFYALEFVDELIWSEVNQLNEDNTAYVACSTKNGRQQAPNDASENVDLRIPERQTEVINDAIVMTIAQNEKAKSAKILSEFSVNEDNCEHKLDEMKFEMKNAKSNLPATDTTRRHSLTYKNEPNIGSLGVSGGQRPTSLVLTESTTRSPYQDSKYGRNNDSQSGGFRSTSALQGSNATTALTTSTKYGRSQQPYGGSKTSSLLPISSAKDSNTPSIDTKYRRSTDDANGTRSTRAYGGQRTGKLDQLLSKSNDTQSTLSTVTPSYTTGPRSSYTTPIIDTKYNRIRIEASEPKFVSDLSQINPKSYESNSTAKTYSNSRLGYATPSAEDSKYSRNEPSATNRSSLLLSGGRATNASTFNESKYPNKQDELSAVNLSNARSINSASSTLDSKIPRTNDEPSANKLSRADTRSVPLHDSKYAKTIDESIASRLPHTAVRVADSSIPSVESRNVRSYVETPTVSADIGRSISVDDVSAGLSRSTRLRRQLRMHSQGSQDQGEDPIERLNRLRARISGALTEVKGVLKHYSTETEPEAEVAVEEQPKKHGDINVSKSVDVPKEEPKQETTQLLSEENEGPIKFRFVKKVRRRSFFDEDDEDREKHEEELAKLKETEKNKELNADKNEQFEPETESEVKKEIKLSSEAVIAKIKGDSSAPDKSSELQNEKREKAEIKSEEVLNELNNSNGSVEIVLPQLIISKPTYDVKSIEKPELIPISEDIQNEIEHSTQETDSPTSPDTHPSLKKPKKKIIIKKAVDRRASIAAVEESKIEPPITPTLSLNLKAQRRPSDSEAVVKKKAFPTITATGENATKVKIIHKVKRPSVKRANASADANASDNNISCANDINGQANFSNKDGTIVATTALAQQLVIDDASLTITTTTTTTTTTATTTPATTTTATTTTTKDKSNSLPTIERKEASAVIVAPMPLSPLRTSETNGQLKSTPKLVSEALAVETIPKTPKTPTTPDEIIPPKIAKIDDSSAATQLKIAHDKIHERLKLSAEKAEKVAVANVQEHSIANVQEHKAEEPIDQKVIPADRAVIKDDRSTVPNAQQQVSNDKTVIQVNAITFTSKPPDVITSDIAKETPPTLSSSPTPTPTSTLDCIHIDATKTGESAAAINSTESTSPSVTSTTVASTTAEAAAMPELQVKTLQAFLKPLVAAPFNITKDECIKKKTVLKKLIRKNSTEKSSQKTDISKENLKDAATKDKSKKSPLTQDDNLSTPPCIEDTTSPTIEKLPFVVPVNSNAEASNEDWIGEFNAEDAEEEELVEELEEVIVEEPVPEKKKRSIKKKVIIKRQPRKLSISDTFFKGPEAEPASAIEEILEKPVAYVKIDTDEEDEYEEIVKPTPPSRGCLKLREFQVGDRVMYAERFRKTQVRWKKGIVLERITSISYKLEVEGKEVPAHISYIKKYTDRKVNFSGKEYLEINYEQIAEEEEQARRYSIWNMV